MARLKCSSSNPTISLLGFDNNSLLAAGKFCRLLTNFANSLDPEQDRQNVGPDLDPNPFDTLIVVTYYFLEIVILKKVKRRKQSMNIYPAYKELI